MSNLQPNPMDAIKYDARYHHPREAVPSRNRGLNPTGGFHQPGYKTIAPPGHHIAPHYGYEDERAYGVSRIPERGSFHSRYGYDAREQFRSMRDDPYKCSELPPRFQHAPPMYMSHHPEHPEMLFMGDPEDNGVGTMTLDQQLKLNQFESNARTLPDPKIVKKAGECRDENERLKAELQALKDQMAEMEARNARKLLDWEYNGLPAEFGFGERYYQCVAPHSAGVGYRFSPDFNDKDEEHCNGPEPNEVIKATAIVQGPNAIFLKCHNTKRWLPMTNSNEQQTKDGKDGKFVPLFANLGRKDEFKLSDHPELKMAEYKVKVSPKSPKKK